MTDVDAFGEAVGRDLHAMLERYVPTFKEVDGVLYAEATALTPEVLAQIEAEVRVIFAFHLPLGGRFHAHLKFYPFGAGDPLELEVDGAAPGEFGATDMTITTREDEGDGD